MEGLARRPNGLARQQDGLASRPASRLGAAIALAIVLAGCAGSGAGSPSGPGISNPIVVASLPGSAEPATVAPTSTEATTMPTTATFTLTSPAFSEGGEIPRDFTCQGADVSPQLAWSGVPSSTAALVLIVDDPDAGDFTHWLVIDLDPSSGGLPQGISPSADAPQQGRNDFGRTGWGGPCPPSGTHRYRFTLSALAAPLRLDGHPGRATVNAAITKATVLATVTLTGTYRKS